MRSFSPCFIDSFNLDWWGICFYTSYYSIVFNFIFLWNSCPLYSSGINHKAALEIRWQKCFGKTFSFRFRYMRLASIVITWPPRGQGWRCAALLFTWASTSARNRYHWENWEHWYDTCVTPGWTCGIRWTPLRSGRPFKLWHINVYFIQ